MSISRKRALIDSVNSEFSEFIIDWKFVDAKAKFEKSKPGNYFVSNELIEKNNHWYLDIYPKGQAMAQYFSDKKKPTEIALWLSLNQKKAKTGPVDVVYYEINILNKHGEVFHTEKSKNTETFDPRTSGLEKNDILTDCRGWLDFHPTSEIEKNWDELLTDDGELVLTCKFKVKHRKAESNKKKTKVDERKINEKNQQTKQQNIQKSKLRKRKKKNNIDLNEPIIDLTFIENDAFQAAESDIEQDDGKNNQQEDSNINEPVLSNCNEDDVPEVTETNILQDVPITNGITEKSDDENNQQKNIKANENNPSSSNTVSTPSINDPNDLVDTQINEQNENQENSRNKQSNKPKILRIEAVASTSETVQEPTTSTYNNIDESDMVFVSQDIKIKCKDNTELNAHKKVLAKHSELLKSNFEENENIEVIDMTEFDSKIVKEMLLFIYWGKIKDIEGNFLPLLKLAKIFRIDSLKEFCSEEYTKVAFSNIEIPLKQLNPKVEELDIEG